VWPSWKEHQDTATLLFAANFEIFRCACRAPKDQQNLFANKRIDFKLNLHKFLTLCDSLRSIRSLSGRRARRISTARLNVLPRLHLQPINLLVSQGSQMKINLRIGFVLRCFQRLSEPDIATQLCPWQNNWYTRGLFIPVLSY
jgi:hypothetical protein